MVKSFDEFIKEGMFSGMVRRANTDQVKKEDDVNNLMLDEFTRYLCDNYCMKISYNIRSSYIHLQYGNEYQYIVVYYEPDNKTIDIIGLNNSNTDIPKNIFQELKKIFKVKKNKRNTYIIDNDHNKNNLNNRSVLQIIDIYGKEYKNIIKH